MLSNQVPTGILKVDYDIPLLGEIGGGNAWEAVVCISDKLKNMPKEASFVMCLDYYYRPICVGLLGYGMTDSVEMSVKETTQFALLTNARAVILLHNHPGNGRKMSDLQPSKADIAVASKIAEALKLFEVELTDSIIFNCEWTKNNSVVAKVHDVTDEYLLRKYQRCPAFYSMRDNRRYRSIFNVDPDKNINLKKPTFSGANVINDSKEAKTAIVKEEESENLLFNKVYIEK